MTQTETPDQFSGDSEKDTTKPLPALNPRQLRFCQLYLSDPEIAGNGTACYKRAGYEPKSDGVAAAAAFSLLNKPHVQAYLNQLREQSTREVLQRHREWLGIAEDARQIIDAIILGQLVDPVGHRLRAAQYAVDRAEGRPSQTQTIDADFGAGALSLTPFVISLSEEDSQTEYDRGAVGRLEDPFGYERLQRTTELVETIRENRERE